MSALTNAALLEQFRELASEINRRLENYLEAAAESPDALDEGYLLATKADRISGAFFWRKWELERLVGELTGEEAA